MTALTNDDNNNIRSNNNALSSVNMNAQYQNLIEEINAAMEREDTSYPCSGDYIGSLSDQSKSCNSLVDLHASMQEKGYPGGCSTLVTSSSESNLSLFINFPADYECRYKMCQWFYQVVNYCKLNQGTAQLCISNLDRFLSMYPFYLKDREDYQLTAISALYLSIKINNSVKLDMKFLGMLCRGRYKLKDIVAMERKMLHCLSWKVNPPTSIFFVYRYLSFVTNALLSLNAPVNIFGKETFDIFERLVVEQAELCTMDSSISCSNYLYKASEVGFACLLNSLEVILDETHLRSSDRASSFKEKLFQEISLLSSRFDQNRIQSLRSKVDRLFWAANDCSLKSCATEWSVNRVRVNKESQLSSASDVCRKEIFDSCDTHNTSFTPNSIQIFTE